LSDARKRNGRVGGRDGLEGDLIVNMGMVQMEFSRLIQGKGEAVLHEAQAAGGLRNGEIHQLHDRHISTMDERTHRLVERMGLTRPGEGKASVKMRRGDLSKDGAGEAEVR
jgi:hypothetical protein